MKVGDIELDTASRPPCASSLRSGGLEATPTTADLREISRIIPLPRWMLLVLGSVAVLGGFGWMLSALLGPWASVPIFAIVLLGLGGGALLLGVLKALPASPGRSAARDDAHTLLEARRARLMAALRAEEKPQTIADLAKTTGFFENVVVDTLVSMKAARVVEEELDLDTGAWTYALTETGSDEKKYLCLEDRQAQRSG